MVPRWQLYFLLPPLIYFRFLHPGPVQLPPFNVLLVHLIIQCLSHVWSYQLQHLCNLHLLRHHLTRWFARQGCIIWTLCLGAFLGLVAAFGCWATPITTLLLLTVLTGWTIIIQIHHQRIKASQAAAQLADNEQVLTTETDDTLNAQTKRRAVAWMLPQPRPYVFLVLLIWASSYIELEQPVGRRPPVAVYNVWLIVLLSNIIQYGVVGRDETWMKPTWEEEEDTKSLQRPWSTRYRKRDCFCGCKKVFTASILYIAGTLLLGWSWLMIRDPNPWHVLTIGQDVELALVLAIWVIAEVAISCASEPISILDRVTCMWAFWFADIIGRHLPHSTFGAVLVILGLLTQLAPRWRVL
jgi:hypothetical protein